MSYGVSEMSMLLQQAFQQATPRWQRKRIVLSSPKVCGRTGLSGKGESGVVGEGIVITTGGGNRG